MKTFTFFVLFFFTSCNLTGTTKPTSPAGWFEVNVPLGEQDNSFNIQDLFFLNRDTGWIVGRKTVKIGNRAYIGFTENGGKDWDFTYLDDETELKTVYFLNRKQGVFTNFAIYYTQDGDQNLSRVNDFGHDKIDHLDFGSPTTGWAAGLGGTIAKTRNGGQSWNYLDVEYSKPFVSVAAIGNRQAWLLSTDLLFHTANGGTTWNEVNLQNAVETTPVRYRAVTFTDTLRGWIVGEFRRILHTTDGGQTWQVQYPRTPQQ